ncbi:pentapeptide repeat-containing protein [Humibacillus xanthopallidus]|uniref:pentapeptide repeat-containing protein n=1 Tax=Humibacillus xanthopallidus TaxID=412689 RepID=UPI00384B14F8
MSVTVTWQLSIDGMGASQTYAEEWRYAGGFIVVCFGDGAGDGWTVTDLGGSQVSISEAVWDSEGNRNYVFYWNSHFPTSRSYENTGMMLWYDPPYSSDSVGPEQTFRIANLGQGTISLQATAGSYPGQFLSAIQGTWYPGEFGFGSSAFLSSPSAVPIRVSGDLLPLLLITNSGYDTDFSNRDLGAIDLANANLQKCNLSGATLSTVTSIAGADFTSATLHGVHLGAHDLATAKTWAHADLTGSDLTTITGASSAHLESAVLDGVNLTGRNLRGAFLQGASLKGAHLDGADLTGAHLDGADLTGAHLGATILHGAALAGTHFDGVDLSTTQFDAVPAFTRGPAARTTFVGATVPFPVLGSAWSYLDLTSATITGIPSAIESLAADHALLPTGLSLQGVDLSGATFAGARMYEAQLQRANLQGATLTGAFLKGAKLSGANLTLANLDSAYLIAESGNASALEATGADLRDKLEAAVVTDAFLVNTVLDGAHCDGVDFSGSLFLTSVAVSPTQSASAVGASMNFARFDGGMLPLATFNGAQLSAASFAGAHLEGASFRDNGSTPTALTPSSDSVHTPASVYEAHLEGADFTGANMDGLNMRGATVATTPGRFQQAYDSYGGAKVIVSFDYAPTRLGTTTGNTTCPNGDAGPCSL